MELIGSLKKKLIEFEESQGELTKALAQTTFEKQFHPQVAFFLQKNPHFYEGVELACLARLHPDNMRGYARTSLENGFNNIVSTF